MVLRQGFTSLLARSVLDVGSWFSQASFSDVVSDDLARLACSLVSLSERLHHC